MNLRRNNRNYGIKKKNENISELQYGVYDGHHIFVIDIFHDNLNGSFSECHQGVASARETANFGQATGKGNY